VVEVMASYKATVTRDGRFWLVRVNGVGSTQARHLRELDAMTKDLIEVMTGDDSEDLTVDYDICLPDEVQNHLHRAEQLRAQSAAAQSAAAGEIRTAARQLHDQGVPLRDVGRMLGVSYQRAHQLVS
jgi:hypothetical protein